MKLSENTYSNLSTKNPALCNKFPGLYFNYLLTKVTSFTFILLHSTVIAEESVWQDPNDVVSLLCVKAKEGRMENASPPPPPHFPTQWTNDADRHRTSNILASFVSRCSLSPHRPRPRIRSMLTDDGGKGRGNPRTGIGLKLLFSLL